MTLSLNCETKVLHIFINKAHYLISLKVILVKIVMLINIFIRLICLYSACMPSNSFTALADLGVAVGTSLRCI